MPKPPRKKRPTRRPHDAGPAAKKAPAKKGKSATPKRKKSRLPLATVVSNALDDMKGEKISLLDVRHLTTVTDTMIVASGRSDRHVRALASSVVEKCKQAGFRPIGVEGQDSGEWVLVDLGDVVVHVMLPRAREFYNLEKLWDMSAREDTAEVAT